MHCFLLFFFFVLAALPCDLFAAQNWQPGFRTLGFSSPQSEKRLDLNIWYPATRKPSMHNFLSWQIQGALNAKPADGFFPVLIISHPSSATRFSLANLAVWLACRGFIVALPAHKHDNLNNMDNLFTWTQLTERVGEINETLQIILRNPDLKQISDPNRIGIIGFGAGANAALLLGGYLPSCAGWPLYCTSQNENDVYCAPLAKEKITALCKQFPLQKSLANPAIKAIALISPGFGMLFDKKSLDYLYPPVLLIEAGKDQFNKPLLHTQPIGRLLGNKAFYLAVPDADMEAFMDACPEAMTRELPELCLSVTASQRKSIRETLQSSLYSFFHRYLQEKNNVPAIPDPPDLSPIQSKSPALTDTRNIRKRSNKTR